MISLTLATVHILLEHMRRLSIPSSVRHFLTSLCVVFVTVAPVAAATEDKTEAPQDCRYKSDSHAVSLAEKDWDPFPDDDVFRPLLADPKQPQLYFRYQYVRLRDVGENLNTVSVAVGEYFGLIGRRQEKDCDGGQLGITGGVFAQFDMGGDSYDLINADYNIGLPFSYRRGPLSMRFRLYHESSHIGDEFLLNHPKFNRLNFTYEEVEAILSYDVLLRSNLIRELRFYGGGAWMFDRQPRIHRAKDQWGIEIRGTGNRIGFLTKVIQKKTEDQLPDQVTGIPFIGLDVKQYEQHRWNLETSVIAGMEYFRLSTRRRLRVYATYYHGFNPYGQFFITQKIESFGAGLSLAF
jgi:hypothetical protein